MAPVRVEGPETWPDSLRTAVSLILNSPESMILAWGPDLHFFFNVAPVGVELPGQVDETAAAPREGVLDDGPGLVPAVGPSSSSPTRPPRR
jgi:hypothetical protein